jgi:hypothetical protein
VPIGFDANLGSTGILAASSTTAVLTTTAAVAAGGTIVLLVGNTGTGIATAVGGGGLTWQKDAQGTLGTPARCNIWSAHTPTGLAAGTAITVTYGAASTNRVVCAVSYLGIKTTAPYVEDVEQQHTANSVANTWTSGPVDTITVGALLVAAAMNGVGDTNTPTAGWTERHQEVVSGSSVYILQDRVVGEVATYNATGKWAISPTVSTGTILIAYTPEVPGVVTKPYHGGGIWVL